MSKLTHKPAMKESASTQANNGPVNEAKVAFSDRQLYQFLPAVLEVTETPPNKVSRWVVWSIIILFLSALLWAYLGKVDIVVVGQGQLITSGKSKLVQSTRAGVIESIKVTEGQQVKQGDLLVQLNSDLSNGQRTQLEQRMSVLTQQLNLERLVVAGLEGAELEDAKPAIAEEGSQSADNQSAETALTDLYQKMLQERKQDQAYKLAQLQQGITAIDRKIADVTQQESYFNKKVPLLEQEVSLLEKINQADNLQSSQKSTALTLVRTKQKLAESQLQLAQLTEQLKQLQGSVSLKEQELAQFQSKARLVAYQKISQLEAQLADTKLQLASMLQVNQAEQITAPYDGTVEQIAVNTQGGYVAPGQVLMKLVPNNEALQAEVVFQNKDIGFVKAGMPMELKVDSFRFTKYGLLEGEIATVSYDAIQQENAGAVFNSRILLTSNNIQMNGETVELKPGMSVVAEAKVGKRRIIDFLLSPVKKTVLESVREQ